MEDFLSFRRMVSPTLIQIVYWLATIMVVIVGLVLISRGGSVAAVGVGYLIVGPLLIRVYAEVVIWGFKAHETLTEIKDELVANRTDARSGRNSPQGVGSQTGSIRSCNNCATRNQMDAKFCVACGTELPRS